MDALCGTSSLWLYPVPALEPHFNKNGRVASTPTSTRSANPNPTNP